MNDLPSRIAFITGGASGIGFAIAQACLEHGMRVVIADVDTAALPEAVAKLGSPAQAMPMALDVRDRAALQDAVAHVESAWGPIQLLVNNAGIGSDGFTLADMPPENFDRLIAINLTGAFNGVHALAARMRERGVGHIVNVASTAGLISTTALGAYCAAKQGLVGLS